MMAEEMRMAGVYHADRRPIAAPIGVALRWLVGLVLLGTALGKSLDLPGFAQVVSTYQVFPDWAFMPVAIFITASEWILGAWMLSGRRAPLANGIAAAMHASYAGWAALALLRGIAVPNCGCFGVFLARPLTWQTVIEDLIVTALCLVALWCSLVRRHAAAHRGGS